MTQAAKSIIQYQIRELNGDTFTPITLFHALKGKKKFLLESSLKHEQSGRYSFIGANPFLELKANGNSVEVLTVETNETKTYEENPITIMKKLFPESFQKDLPFPFFGGAVGYIGYDFIRHYESIGTVPQDEIEMPDIHLMYYEQTIIFDHLDQKVTIVAMNYSKPEESLDLEEILMKIENELLHATPPTSANDQQSLEFISNTEKEEFINMVEVAKEHILSGDIFQVVLSHRLKATFEGDPFIFYRKLRKSNPSPYMFYVDFDEYVVLGASPESLIKVDGKTVTTNPIAGTRKRGRNEGEDQQLEQELRNDEKEVAEHRMLVDLGRNDLGRVCEIGSIELTKYMVIERYKYVMHLVSEVKGTLHPSINPFEALASCLPAGTVTGAPKIRAMQIINTLEKTKRGVYSGAVGYININGDFDFALAIRTMVIKNGQAFVQAGAGIVYDSVPENEYEETMNKAKALLEVPKL